MAKQPKQSAAPSPSDDWQPPKSDQEFVFESVDAAPAWIDKNWAGFDRGPALQVPAGDLYGGAPYTTKTARVGDKVVFTAAKGGMGAKLDVIPGLPDPKEGGTTKKPPQQSAVALEEALKSGSMTPDDLGDDATAQVISRTPSLRTLIEDGTGAPDAQSVGDVVKLD